MTSEQLLANLMRAMLSRHERWNLKEHEFQTDAGPRRGYVFDWAPWAIEIDGEHARAVIAEYSRQYP